MEHANAEPFELDRGMPVAITLRFFFPHPKKHFIKCHQTGLLKLAPNAPVFVTKTPDIDNCIKLVLDALQGICCKNDCEIVHIDAAKQFDMSQRVWTTETANKGCTLNKITQVNESNFDSACNCLSCKHKKKTTTKKQNHDIKHSYKNTVSILVCVFCHCFSLHKTLSCKL